MKRLTLVSVLLALVPLSITFTGCGGSGGTADASIAKTDEMKKPPEVVIPVQAETAKRGSISSYFDTTARVEAERKVNVMAEAVGTCISVLKDEGQQVNAGDVLAELDREEALASYSQNEVQVRKSKADFLRAQELAKSGLISKEQYEATRFAYEQGEASLKTQRVQLEKMTIKAPISGVITTKNLQVGQLVTSGAPAFSIVDPSSFTLSINPPEKDLQRLHIDQVAKVVIDALGGREFDAHVRRINPGVDPISGTIKVVLDFDPELRKELRDAAFARVKLVLETKENVLLVPKDAIIEENARRYVFIVEEAGETAPDQPATVATTPDDEKSAEPAEPAEPASDGPKMIAKRVEIETGFEDSDRMEVLRGITDDTLVVTLGQFNLKADSPVRITSMSDEMAAAGELSLEEALKQGREKRGDNPEVAEGRGGGRRR